MRRFRGLVVGAGYLAALPLVLNGVSVFATAYIIHGLGPYRFGQWGVAASLTATSAFLSNLGLRPLFVRRLAEESSRSEELLGDQLGIRLVLGCVAGIVAVCAAWILGYDWTVVACTVIAGVGLALTVGWTALGDTLQASSRFAQFALAQFVGGVVLTTCSVVAVRLGAGPKGVALAYVAGPAVSFCALGVAVRRAGIRIKPKFSWNRAWALLYESRHIGLQQVVVTFRDRADDLLVPKLVGIAAFGHFSAGVMPADRLSIVSDSIATAFFPTIAGDQTDNRVVASRTMLLLSVAATIPLAIALGISAPVIARVLFPGDSDRCRLVMQITACSIPVAGAARCLTAALQAVGRHAEAARASVISTVVGAMISFCFIASWGIVGAAWSWLTRATILALLLTPQFRRTFPARRLSRLRVAAVSGVEG